MGTSYVTYKGFGFWSRDSSIEDWLLTLLTEMKKSPKPEPWQNALMEHWRVQAQIDGGCISIALDEFLTNKSREQVILTLAKQALPLTEPLTRRTGELFIELLEGKLYTNESSPIDYLI